MASIFFQSGHKTRFFEAMKRAGELNNGRLDPEYSSALYILTANSCIWRKAQSYVDCDGIDISSLLAKVDFSHGYTVLVQWAGNLFNGEVHVDPVELSILDENNFLVALNALKIRRYGLDIGGSCDD